MFGTDLKSRDVPIRVIWFGVAADAESDTLVKHLKYEQI